ncbi:SMI1-KNR4 cell wall assembly regulator protein [Rickettsiales bacterium Ac37b]|nr:SMI1-KNR4 cell wall assembly regulator protein [Rickettsiales bacterium Ac37b]
MSYADYKEAINWIKNNEEKCFIRKGNTIDEINKAEKKLVIELPKSYKEFLSKYGYWSCDSKEIYGLYNNTLIDFTIDQRNVNHDYKFPLGFVPIHELGNGEKSCLDTSQMNEEGECPVVAWYFGPTLPNGKCEILAEDFGAFLLDKVKSAIESLEEEE